MNVPKSTESHLLLKNSSTRNIQQVFVTWKSLKIAMMAMKTKGFMIRICDEMKNFRQNSKEQNNPPFFPNP